MIADMHCDTLTREQSRFGMRNNVGLQTDFCRLRAAGYGAQCFAVFMRSGTMRKFMEYADFFSAQVAANGDICARVLCSDDLSAAISSGRLGCILTAENIGFARTEEDVLQVKSAGVRMASLVWNEENALAFPNLVSGKSAPDFSLREGRRLKKTGRDIAELLDEYGIIIDISHLSDGGADELLNGRRRPLVASHSNASSLHSVCRNLTDRQIRAVADCGGVVGVNFCLDFLGGDDAVEGAFAHIRYIIAVGGEDCAAIGGDLDGMPAQRGAEDCTRAARIGELLAKEFGARLADKVCSGNFMRVFKEVVG